MRAPILDLIQDVTAQSEGLAQAHELEAALNFSGFMAELDAQNKFETGMEVLDISETAEASAMVSELQTAAKFLAKAAEAGSSNKLEAHIGKPVWTRERCSLFGAKPLEKQKEDAPVVTTAPAA